MSQLNITNPVDFAKVLDLANGYLSSQNQPIITQEDTKVNAILFALLQEINRSFQALESRINSVSRMVEPLGGGH